MSINRNCGLALTCALAFAAWGAAAAQTASATQETFATPDEAAKALIAAADNFDVARLKAILGPDGVDLVETGDPVYDKQQSLAFAAQAREKSRVDLDPAKPKVATLVVGDEDWPMPIPIVRKSNRWQFDSKQGRTEILYRRIGGNELAAISVCEGYVEAQFEYATEKHEGSPVNQYARRVISTPGKQDGLAWQAADGTWQGPVGDGIARAIGEGYSSRYQPYHGYYFKILMRQGPAAPLGEMDYIVGGVMIGGFAMVAAPTDYRVTGVNTFIVGSEGVVYQKDLGPTTLEQFRAMDTYNPDKTWSPASDR
jgi:hypothetical protein